MSKHVPTKKGFWCLKENRRILRDLFSSDLEGLDIEWKVYKKTSKYSIENRRKKLIASGHGEFIICLEIVASRCSDFIPRNIIKYVYIYI